MNLEVNEETSRKSWVILVVALCLAAAAAWLTSFYLDNKEQEIRSSLVGIKETKIPIVVPKNGVNVGDLISGANMVVRKIPKQYVPDGAFSPSDFKGLIGRTITANVSAGKPLLENSIAGIGIEQFSDLLEEGHRAITLSMDEFNSTAGMLVAGDRIDLFLLAKKSKVKDETSKKKSSALYLILENAVVLATGKQTVEDGMITKQARDEFDQYNTITLGVPLRDAGRIGLARKDGDFLAMLRNRDDIKKVKYRYLDNNDVYTHVAKTQHSVEYIIGGTGNKGVAAVNKQSVEAKKLANKLTEMSDISDTE